MSVQIIKRNKNNESQIETIERVKNDAPQVSYNSEGRIAIRIPRYEGDTLLVFDRPLTKELIRFIKSAVQELPSTSCWCAECSKEFEENRLPF
jgi:hypothetical protein